MTLWIDLTNSPHCDKNKKKIKIFFDQNGRNKSYINLTLLISL